MFDPHGIHYLILLGIFSEKLGHLPKPSDSWYFWWLAFVDQPEKWFLVWTDIYRRYHLSCFIKGIRIFKIIENYNYRWKWCYSLKITVIQTFVFDFWAQADEITFSGFRLKDSLWIFNSLDTERKLRHDTVRLSRA